VKAIKERLEDNLCFAFRNFPLSTMHPHAEHAAEAAEAAAAQGRFWEMHENQEDLEDEDLERYAEALNLDVERLMREVRSGAHATRIREDFRTGVRGGVNGTPSFFINGQRYDGAHALDPLVEAINQSGGGQV